MILTFDDILNWFERVYRRTLGLAQCVPDNYLGWRPVATEFSIADIIRHIGSTELMNMQRLETGQLVYAGHNEKHGQSKVEIIGYLENCHKKAVEILTANGNEVLIKLVPTNQGQIEGWRVIFGMIEHEIHHRSQLCGYFTQLGIEAPPLFGLYTENLPIA